ncbi:DNA (cytosine-5)-methyltransferase 1 [Rhizobium sp. ERR 922]|uniref:DNA cytosine methyltransferase n=1 Tax=unclassified Rhizobium TaxID=2613769 RepID=UPI00119ED1B3|nr:MULTISPECIES: DNA cytosine methyltransferase [unclassified Rhizobium]TWB45555.1 DNA (cytosine-5)-methyltransferase 1 [Rhizobium sp. ERR 922]TWB88210.1 DNA (cytosine-5)-methyltransferase 1 [Rhizobium sp. ERR 942]
MSIDPKVIRQKIQRLIAGARPRVLDLFSGCGGLSLGFQSAGFEIVAAVENDPDAARSHGLNFHHGEDRHSIPRDITATSPAALATALDLGPPASAFDVIVGGPPCQAFARVGRSKLREIAEHPEAFRHDSRARLYIEYLAYVEACAPLAVVIENVPDMLNHGGHNLAAEISEVLASKDYVVRYTLLNAAFYGVPQMRERMILIAIRKELADDIEFPAPTHWIDLPSGYQGSRAVALKLATGRDLLTEANGGSAYKAAPEAAETLAPAVTTQQAIGDLPEIMARELLAEGTLRRGTRRLDAMLPYDGNNQQNDYVKEMRTWSGFEGSSHVRDHVIRYLPRDYRIFAGLKPGDQYPEAHRYALSLFEAELERLHAQGNRPEYGSSEWDALKAAFVPPYDAGKFPNKWRKMEAITPARTLLAHLGKDGYSHIHYDSRQARPISVREAARLQSFPDGFRFAGTMNPAFRQIGNAVPPLLARAIAQTLRSQLARGVATEELPCAAGAGR